jgi:hypothetical protein
VASLRRFLAQAPGPPVPLVRVWRSRFAQQMAPVGPAEQERLRQARPRRRGRPPDPLVTGSLIGDDATVAKPKGTKMAGRGRHYSTTAGTPVRGHSLVQGLYVLRGRRGPRAPPLDQQQTVCQAADVPFRRKLDLLVELVQTCVPVAGPRTPVRAASWYGAQRLGRTARDRGFLITTGLQANRSLRVRAPPAAPGWGWQRLDAYAADLRPDDFTLLDGPRQSDEAARQVSVHVVSTRVRRLYRGQVVIARPSLEAPTAATRYWASSDLTAEMATLLGHIAARWDVETFLGEAKDVLGVDQYQVMTTTALVRCWTLALAAYTLLEEEQARLSQERPAHVTIGAARRVLQHRHYRHLLGWIEHEHELHTGVDVDTLYDRLIA